MRSAFASRRSLIADQSGAAALEFAMIAPVLITCIAAIIMVGLAYYDGATVQWSMERALRSAMLDAEVTQTEIEELMADDLARIGSPDINLTYEIDDSGPAPLAVATATYDVPLRIPLLPDLSLEFVAESIAPVPAALSSS